MNRAAHENPFRVDRVTRLAFIDEANVIGALAERASAAVVRGAIVGPEGSGKSTLLRALLSVLEARGHRLVRVQLGASATTAELQAAAAMAIESAGGVVAIDGFEQFGWRLRRRVMRRCPRLLVTAHRPLRIPTIVHLQPGPSTLDAILARLLDRVSLATRDFAQERLSARGGDIRATLFDCYDAWAGGTLQAESSVSMEMRVSSTSWSDESAPLPPSR
ncbi:MAG: hypothetical protein ACTHM6_19535 [Tepidisphaeraceae bacterium]